MKISQLFTPKGILGVLLWVAGPVLAGAGFGWAGLYTYGSSYPTLSIVMIVAGSIVTLISVPMMLIGRTFHNDER